MKSQKGSATTRWGVEYRPVLDLPGYRVGSDGIIWSRRKKSGMLSDKWQRLSGYVNSVGYLQVSLSQNHKTKILSVHRLVLEAFVGLCPDGMQCRHLDGNPRNNHLSNLKWGTPKENGADCIRHGTRPRGSKHGMAKLTEEDIPTIRQRLAHGESTRSIGSSFQISGVMVSRIKKGKNWKHVEE